MKKGGFAGAGGGDDGDELAWSDGKIDVAEAETASFPER